MTNWRYRDRIFKAILARNVNPDDEFLSVEAIKKELLPYLQKTSHWQGVCEENLADLKRARTFHALNRVLALLYDYADENKIWLDFISDGEIVL